MKTTACYLKRLYLSIPVALVAWLLLCFLPCQPVNAAPVLALDISTGPVGTPVTITGTIFHSYEGDSIHILFDTTEIETITIPAGGMFTVSWVIPAEATGGVHTIGAKRETTDSSFFISAPFTVDLRQLTLDTHQGKTGTTVNMNATGFYINEDVTISYNNPNENAIGTVTASADGKFSYSYTIPAGTGGYHQFRAYNTRGNIAETYFRIVPDIIAGAEAGAPGELLTVTGTGFGAADAVSIYLGVQLTVITISDNYGNFEAQFAIPELGIGTYTLKAQDNLGNKAEIQFPITAGATLSENTGSTGDEVTVTGDGFQAGSTITVTYDDEPVAYTVADNNGTFTISFEVPLSEGGEHNINITDGNTTRQYTYTVETTPPDIPGQLTPASNSFNGAYTVFSWNAVTDTSLPVTYRLEIATDANFTSTILIKEDLTEANYTLTGAEALAANAEGTPYYWRVMASDGAGNKSGWSEAWAFNIGGPEAPILSLPVSGEKMEYPISLSWTASESLSGEVTYNLQVSRNSDFTELLISETGITGTLYAISEENKTIFNKKIPYYWRVNAEDNAHNTSAWSNTGSFNIASTGFPAWATWLLSCLGAVIVIWLIYKFVTRKTYH